MKKTLFVLSILALVTLASCGNNNPNNPTPENPGENNNNNNNNTQPEEKTIPVYQGMEVKDSASSSDKKSARKYYSDMEVGTDQVDYYAEANSDFYLHIHIYNPEQFEILSFTLNDYKYQSYQFEEGSTGSLLILKLKTPLEPGYHEYFLSNIKYIDGTEIKDVDMSEANKSVKIGVQYMDYPTFEIADEEIGYEKYSATFNVEDYQDIYLQYGATISVSKDNKVIFEKDYTEDKIYLQLDNLETNSEYFVEIYSEFETFKGNGIENVSLYSGSFTTKNGVEIVATTNKRDASFEVNSYLDNFNILTADLYKDGALITGAEDFVNIKFDDLYSDSAYELVLTYEYGQNYYHGEERLTFTTKEVTKPSAETEIISSSKNSVEFKTDTIDSDNTIKEISYELYDGSKLVDSSKNETMFDGLLSNHSYGLKTIVTYDLYNGEGNKTIELTDTFTTQKNNLPTVTIGTISPSYESVDFDFKIEDSDKVITDVKVIVSDYDGVVKIGDENTRSFDSLLACHYYELKVELIYDLRDGKGEQTTFASEHFYTETYEGSYASLTNYVVDNDSIKFDLVIEDADNLITDITINLYDNGEIVATGDENTRSFDSLLSNHNYDIEVVTTFDMRDGQGERKIYFQDHFYTNAYSQPEVKLFNVIPSFESVSFDLDFVDVDNLIKDIKINVLDSGEVVATGDKNTRSFDSLLSEHDYEIQVVTTYDLKDGNREQTMLVNEYFQTEKYGYLDPHFFDIVTGYESISFKFSPGTMHTNLIKGIKYNIYDGDEIVVSLDDNNTSADSLLSDHDYKIEALVTYDRKDGEGERLSTHSIIVRTQKYTMPDIYFSDIVPEYDLVNFKFNVDTIHPNIIKDVKINVLDNGEIVSSGDENTTNLDSLLSNHDYQLQAIVTYDMKDGTGAHSYKLVEDFHTQSYVTPDICFSDIVAENGSIEFKLNENDEHNLTELKSIELYENDVLKETITDLSKLRFDGLTSGVRYNLVANYFYNKRDGSGEHLLSVWDNGYTTIDGKWIPNARQLPENIQAIRVTEDRVYGVFFLGIPEEKRMAFWDAQEMCETYGGHLITITSDEELQIAQDLLDEQNSEINNTAGSLVGGYYENGSWHWVTGEEFVVNKGHFYYPGTIGPSEGDVLATWFESAKFWYQSRDTKNPAVLIELEGDKPTTGIYLK